MGETVDVVQELFEALRPDGEEVTGLVYAEAIAEALAQIDDDTLTSGDADRVREAMTKALRGVREAAAWREGLAGAALDSLGGRLVLGAVRSAMASMDLQAIVRDVRQAHDAEDGERLLAGSLIRLDRAAVAELASAPPNVLDVYALRTGACWAVPRDPMVAPKYWNPRAGRLETDPRMTRDWALLTIGEVEGASWKCARIATANNLAQAADVCRHHHPPRDPFQDALEAERIEAGDA